MHPLLKRQLKRFIGESAVEADSLPSPWREFVAAVGAAYEASAADLELINRSMEIASAELGERNAMLLAKNAELNAIGEEIRRSHDELEKRVAERTADLQHAMEQAEAANRAKSAFLANMSHEIRTPMSAILGYADMLLADGFTQEKRLEFLGIIRQQGEHLLTILNDILDLSKIEAEKLSVERIDCDPGQIISEAVSLMRVRALEKKIDCVATYSSPMPSTIRTDPTRLRQILMNLLSNAIKFTDAGSVQVLTSVRQQGQAACLCVEVIDSGIGMTPQQIAGLFKPFAQADDSTTRRFGGTGLGLSICKRLAQMLGGDILVESQLGCGARFILTIDAGDLSQVTQRFRTEEGEREAVAPAAEAPVDAEAMIGVHGRVLLAEDGQLNQRVFRFYLEGIGAEVVSAENGVRAVELATAAQLRGEPFDAILLDMQMPLLDGYGAATQLRANGYTGPIIALTAHAMSGDRDQCIAAGCSDYMTKPVERQRLVALVQSHLRPGAASAAPVQSTAVDTVICRFVPMFIESLPASVDSLRAALRAADVATLKNELHKLKGTGAMYGFQPITTLAAAAEEQLLSHKPVEAVAADVAELVKFIAQIDGVDKQKLSLEDTSGVAPCLTS